MKVLLVEDEPAIATPVMRALQAQGLEVRVANDLVTGREAIAEAEPDLMILDVGLVEHEDGGFILAREARNAGFSGSILFLTARDALMDRVQGLDEGGDDYVVKPFELLELMARVRALLRRPTEARSNRLRFGALEMDLSSQEVRFESRRVELSSREFGLLERLALSPTRVFSAEELLDLVWGDAASTPGVVKVNVHRLREKLSPVIVRSSRRGYQFGLEPTERRA